MLLYEWAVQTWFLITYILCNFRPMAFALEEMNCLTHLPPVAEPVLSFSTLNVKQKQTNKQPSYTASKRGQTRVIGRGMPSHAKILEPGRGKKTGNVRVRRLSFHQKLYLSKLSQGGRRKLVIIFLYVNVYMYLTVISELWSMKYIKIQAQLN